METIDNGFRKWEAMLLSRYGVKARIVADKRTPDHEGWLRVRKSGVGGSDIGPVLGNSKYRCAVDVYLDKTGQDDKLKEIGEGQQAIMDSGSDMEELILSLYRKKTGRKAVLVNAILGLAGNRRVIVNVDALAQRDDGTWGVLEIKNSLAVGEEWKDGKVPLAYEDQCRYGMMVTGLRWGEVVSLRSGRWTEHSVYAVGKDTEWEAKAVSAVDEFWSCVENRCIPRIPEGSAVARTLWREAMARAAGEMEETTKTATPDVDAAVSRYIALKKEVSARETLIAECQGVISDFMGGPGTLGCSSGKVSWKRNKETSTFDRRRFEKENPEMAERYVEFKPGAMMMRIS